MFAQKFSLSFPLHDIQQHIRPQIILQIAKPVLRNTIHVRNMQPGFFKMPSKVHEQTILPQVLMVHTHVCSVSREHPVISPGRTGHGQWLYSRCIIATILFEKSSYFFFHNSNYSTTIGRKHSAFSIMFILQKNPAN